MQSRTFWLLTGLMALGACEKAAEHAGPVLGAESEAWLSQDQVRQAKLQVKALTAREVGAELSTAGRITYDDLRVSHVYSPVTGRITQITAQLGQKVKKGDTLAVVLSPDLGIASSDVDKARADLAAAEADWRRQKGLYAKGAATQRDYDSANDAYHRTTAEFERSMAKAKLLRGTQAEGATDQAYNLRSLIDGEVIARNANPGAEIQGQYAGGNAVELFTVANLDSVWVLSDIYEVDLARIHAGETVRIKVEAYPDKIFAGAVDWVSDTLDPTVRTAKVRCVVSNAAGLLKPDMFAEVAIGSTGRQVLTVPRQSVMHMGEKTVVFVQSGSNPTGDLRYVRKPVIVDEDEEGENIPVLHGLQEGEMVVIDGAQQLAEKI